MEENQNACPLCEVYQEKGYDLGRYRKLDDSLDCLRLALTKLSQDGILADQQVTLIMEQYKEELENH